MEAVIKDGSAGASRVSPAKQGSLGLLGLTSLVVGSMIGSGAFSLPQNLAAGAGAGAILIGWVITAVGMLTLARVFQMLALSRPDIKGGVYGYARAGFGDYLGFSSAWGYWLSAWIGNTGYLVLLFSALSWFFPGAGFGEGNTLAAVAGASALLWAMHALVLRGAHTAALVNTIATVAKLVPLALFVVCAMLAAKIDTLRLDFWGSPALGGLLSQVKSTMLVTVWAFIGIEGASVYSGRARAMQDVGRATVLGLMLTLGLLIAVSVLSLAVLPQAELAQLKNPSMGGVLSHVLGPWGAALVNGGLIISVAGALLAWTLLAAELPHLAALDGVFPRLFGRANQHDAPVTALWLTNLCVQGFLLLSMFANGAYLLLIKLATSTILLPYLLCALFALMVARQDKVGRGALLVALLASVYGIWLLYAAGPAYLLVTAFLYAPGVAVYGWARREAGLPFASRADWPWLALTGLSLLACLLALATGWLDLAKL
ncbi:basic amino acid/polyamine antiporter [Chitinimonas sp.]|uniref:basic amino acid/polyamine antiporter n=1 Tax=Chitinimonas sp. TaxID=1934313 RepID=UPI0035ADE702